MSEHNQYHPEGSLNLTGLIPPSAQVRLVSAASTASARSWPAGIDLPSSGSYVVTGASGSGVSSFLIDTAIARLAAGADPEGLVVIASSQEAGSRLRRELAQRLDNYASSASLVRSVHSLAHSVVSHIHPEVRLSTGAAQDAEIRTLLAGHAATGAGNWPAQYRPALAYAGFARQLRDFLLRAGERGLGPEELIRLGHHYQRPMWVAAGEFFAEYEQINSLRGNPSYSAAEMINHALAALHGSAAQPAAVPSTWHTVIVDDAQLLDPQSAQFIAELSRQAQLSVVGGDEDQAVYGFRGASAHWLRQLRTEATVIDLGPSRRQPAPTCLSIVNSPAQRNLEVIDAIRRRHLDDGIPWQDIAVIVRAASDIQSVSRTLLSAGIPVHISPTDTVLAHNSLIAALLLALRALSEPLSDSQLEDFATGPVGQADAILVRRLIRGLRRWAPAQRGIDSLRMLLEADSDPATSTAAQDAADAAAGTVAAPAADAAAADAAAAAGVQLDEVLSGVELETLRRMWQVLAAGRAAEREGSIEDIIWAVWSASGLASHLQHVALRGGAAGSQADRDLDAVMTLFDRAGDFAERRHGAKLSDFIAEIEQQELATGVRDRRLASPAAVTVLSAHGAVGQEWDTVIVLGLQEGQWPSLLITGSLFDQQELIDLSAGRDFDGGAATPLGSERTRYRAQLAERLAEERRLFHVATTRHRSRLHIVAIDDMHSDPAYSPSRLLSLLDPHRSNMVQRLRSVAIAQAYRAGEPLPVAAPASPTAPELDQSDLVPHLTVLSRAELVADLRRILLAADSDESTKTQAARQLARLAAAGVPGADPQQWWTARATAGNEPLELPTSLSPSRIERLLQCPLYAELGPLADDGQPTLAAHRGTLVHAYSEAVARGVDSAVARERVLAAFAQLDDSPAWARAASQERFAQMLDNVTAWMSFSPRQLVDVEVAVDVPLDENIRIRGRIDRLELGENDTYHIVDFKTAATAISQTQAQDNIQLQTYQLALASGQLVEDPPGTGRMSIHAAEDGQQGLALDGAALVYPAHQAQSPDKTPTATQRDQAPLSPERTVELREQLRHAVAQLRGPQLRPQAGPYCSYCPLRHMCPAQEEGGISTDVR